MPTVLVTGASSGIGKATAEKLLRHGHIVYAASRRIEKMRGLEESGARLLAMDISKDADIVSAVERITAEHGGVDVLVNNAGFGGYGAVEDTPIDDARYQFEVNLFGLARLTQLVLPHMREQRRGTIVNMSSMGGRIHTPLGSWYHATKHALEGWSDALRLEVAPFGVHVVLVEPGVIATEFGDVAGRLLREHSGSTAYASMANRVAANIERGYRPGVASPPAVVADAVVRAVTCGRPKTRYVVGKYARLLLAAHALLPDRAFDRVVTRTIG